MSKSAKLMETISQEDMGQQYTEWDVKMLVVKLKLCL